MTFLFTLEAQHPLWMRLGSQDVEQMPENGWYQKNSNFESKWWSSGFRGILFSNKPISNQIYLFQIQYYSFGTIENEKKHPWHRLQYYIYIYYFYYDGYIMIHPYCDWWINSYFRVVPPFRNSNFQSPSLALWYNSPGRQIVHWMSIHMALAEKSATPNPLVNPHPYWDCHLGTLW